MPSKRTVPSSDAFRLGAASSKGKESVIRECECCGEELSEGDIVQKEGKILWHSTCVFVEELHSGSSFQLFKDDQDPIASERAWIRELMTRMASKFGVEMVSTETKLPEPVVTATFTIPNRAAVALLAFEDSVSSILAPEEALWSDYPARFGASEEARRRLVTKALQVLCPYYAAARPQDVLLRQPLSCLVAFLLSWSASTYNDKLLDTDNLDEVIRFLGTEWTRPAFLNVIRDAFLVLQDKVTHLITRMSKPYTLPSAMDIASYISLFKRVKYMVESEDSGATAALALSAAVLITANLEDQLVVHPAAQPKAKITRNKDDADEQSAGDAAAKQKPKVKPPPKPKKAPPKAREGKGKKDKKDAGAEESQGSTESRGLIKTAEEAVKEKNVEASGMNDAEILSKAELSATAAPDNKRRSTRSKAAKLPISTDIASTVRVPDKPNVPQPSSMVSKNLLPSSPLRSPLGATKLVQSPARPNRLSVLDEIESVATPSRVSVSTSSAPNIRRAASIAPTPASNLVPHEQRAQAASSSQSRNRATITHSSSSVDDSVPYTPALDDSAVSFRGKRAFMEVVDDSEEEKNDDSKVFKKPKVGKGTQR